LQNSPTNFTNSQQNTFHQANVNIKHRLKRPEIVYMYIGKAIGHGQIAVFAIIYFVIKQVQAVTWTEIRVTGQQGTWCTYSCNYVGLQ